MNSAYFRRIMPLLVVALATALPAQAEDPPAAKPKVPFTISKETTYIVEPLDKDGYPDYIAAINQRCRKGVTPENNAAGLFWRAMGPGEILARQRAEYFKQLGIDPLPEKGDYFVSSVQYAKRLNDAEKVPAQKFDESVGGSFLNAHTKAAKRPWSKQEFPQVAAWLDANEKPLALMIEASKRPRRFDPLVGGRGMLIAVLPPALQPYREASRALAARAMLRLNDGRVEDSWEDLLACHRLARLCAEGPTFVDYVVGVGLDGISCSAEQGMLQQTQLSAAQAEKMRDDLDCLPAMPRIADEIEIGERFSYLDSIGCIAREGAHGLTQSAQYAGLGADSPEQKAYQKSVYEAAGAGPIDWDSILRLGNANYDRIVDSIRKSTRPERKAIADEFDLRIRKNMTETQGILRTGLDKSADRRKVVSDALGHILCGLFISGLHMVSDAEDRGLMRFDLTKLAFALAAYRAEHGAYPAKLAELTPKYVATIPKDRFNDGDLHYSLQGGGYLLYSVGPNGKDDGGKGIEDSKEGSKRWDDIAIRITKP